MFIIFMLCNFESYDFQVCFTWDTFKLKLVRLYYDKSLNYIKTIVEVKIYIFSIGVE